MSLKFQKNRSVPFAYHAVPMYYTGIIHPTNKDKELIIVDFLGKHCIAAWRNNKRNMVGIHFLLKEEQRKGKFGFIFKDKFIPFNKRSGWVF